MNKWRKIMDRKNIKLVIDGNDVYELDLECIRRKQKKNMEENREAADKEDQEHCDCNR